ncbi:uncharacterized protein LOC114520383 [Dendronephthya gigantea]|uniref:uncharacterized protein LOC114520383 n=1 Tax=Dendronephthya gigantea TaxID=151771 RepID=UPI00106BD759|nr:uncharacterized protein LOC114520383 [Dendronephthya gigantea]
MEEKLSQGVMNYTPTNEKYYKFDIITIPDILISFFGIVSHVLLLAAFIKDPLKCFRNAGICLIVNLAVSDFIVCLLGPINATLMAEQTQLYLQDRFIMINYPLKHRVIMSAKVMAGWIVLTWVLGTMFAFKWLIFGHFIACILRNEIEIHIKGQTRLYLGNICGVNYRVSVITIFSISLDRYIIVNYPLKHRVLMNTKVMAGWLALIWLLGTILFFKWLMFGVSAKDEEIKNYASSSFALLAVLFYAGTYFCLKKQSRNILLHNFTNTTTTRNQETRILKEKRFLTTIILIAFITFVCVVPPIILHQVTITTKGMGDDNESKTVFKTLYNIMGVLYYFNFAINPLIYVIRFPNYRKTFYCMYLKK